MGSTVYAWLIRGQNALAFTKVENDPAKKHLKAYLVHPQVLLGYPKVVLDSDFIDRGTSYALVLHKAL